MRDSVYCFQQQPCQQEVWGLNSRGTLKLKSAFSNLTLVFITEHNGQKGWMVT
jgi:hypothetical protein